MQFALTRHAELQDVPLILDFARTELDRQALRLLVAPQVFGFPFAGPPGLLPEVRDLLRNAFGKTMLDPSAREDAAKIRLDVAPVDGQLLERTVGDVYAASPEVVARAKELIAPN